jgi:hydrogenase maturation protein HypF
VATRDAALNMAAQALRAGQVVALKGIGGFQFLVDARDDAVVRRLRHRKHRNEKPFAVMYPDVAGVEEACLVSPLERRLLQSAEAPIVLLSRRDRAIAGSVAPGVPWLGVMLPYTPLHHLLLGDLGFPVVATSGNLSDEPICIDEHEALDRLGGIADGFLVHDRPIVRHVDDSVARVLLDREQVLRRARGYAPLPLHTSSNLPNVLAVGAHLKNTVALARGNEIFVSQHIGDLETPAAFDAFRAATEDLQHLYECRADTVTCDLHPDYLSTKHAGTLSLPMVSVQHHHAHVLACMADNEIAGSVLGVSWDGTGYGPDGTVWGGEFLVCRDGDYERVAHLRTFMLPGGEAAVKQPWRSALGVRYELLDEAAFSEEDPPALRQILRRGINSPVTSSAGRLFDAVASMLGLCEDISFEGQAAMALEWAIAPGVEDAYPIHGGDIVDWGPTIDALLEDDAPVGVRAACFHNALTEAIVQVARRMALPKVVLTGGCFQNRYLSERTVSRLRAEGFQPYWHQRVPPNDGGIAVGQVMAAYHASGVEQAPYEKAAMR